MCEKLIKLFVYLSSDRVDEVMVNREGTYNKSVKERTVQCPICPRKLLDEAALIKHIRLVCYFLSQNIQPSMRRKLLALSKYGLKF